MLFDLLEVEEEDDPNNFRWFGGRDYYQDITGDDYIFLNSWSYHSSCILDEYFNVEVYICGKRYSNGRVYPYRWKSSVVWKNSPIKTDFAEGKCKSVSDALRQCRKEVVDNFQKIKSELAAHGYSYERAKKHASSIYKVCSDGHLHPFCSELGINYSKKDFPIGEYISCGRSYYSSLQTIRKISKSYWSISSSHNKELSKEYQNLENWITNEKGEINEIN